MKSLHSLELDLRSYPRLVAFRNIGIGLVQLGNPDVVFHQAIRNILEVIIDEAEELGVGVSTSRDLDIGLLTPVFGRGEAT